MIKWPDTVEKQIAIIYCGTNGLLSDIPIEKVKDFENEFLEFMEFKHKDLLSQLAQGKLSDEITSTIESTAKEIVEKYK